MVTDKIGDLIIKLKNAGAVRKESISVYSSKINDAVLNVLVKAGYVQSVSKRKNSRMLDVILSYKSDKSSKITGVQRISKPSRRVYTKYSDIKSFKNGYGSTVLSTPLGLLVDKEAVKQKVGGELLFKIW